MKILIAVAAMLASAWFVTGDAFAQKKKAGGCPANYAQTCQSTCSARGGQIRLCPQYCAKRMRENCK